MTMVLSTHDLNFAAALCGRLVLLSDGQVLAARPDRRRADVLNGPGALRGDADVQLHARAGHLTVTPIAAVLRRRRPSMTSIRRRLATTVVAFGALLLATLRVGAAGRIDRHLARARVRLAPCHSPTTSTRRSSSSPACRACSRPRSSAVRSRSRASCSRRCFGNPLASPDTLGVSAARPSGPCSRSRSVSTFRLGVSAVPLASFAGSAGALAIVYTLSTARRRGPLDHGAAPRWRHDDRVLLGARHVRAVPGRFHGHVPTVRWLMGIARRRRLRADRGGAAVLIVAFGLLATLPRPLESAEPGCGRGICERRRRRSSSSVLALVSARRSPRGRPYRSAAPSALSASSFHTWSGWWSGRTIAWCCPHRRSSEPRFSSRVTSSSRTSSRRLRCRSAL